MDMNFDWKGVNGLAKALGGRIDLLEKIFGKKVRDNLKYSDIQKIVKSGFASEFFDLGDEIMTKYTAIDGTVYDFPWRIVDFRDVYWENDPNPHPGMVLQAKYATAETIQFDAAENTVVDASETTALYGWYYFGKRDGNNNYIALNLNVGDPIPHDAYDSIHKCGIESSNDYGTNVLAYGYNRYKHSAIRQWLNSDAEKSNWWASQHVGDVAPEEADTLNGFLRGFEKSFIDCIVPIKINTWTNNVTDAMALDTTYDKIFLPSCLEMYCTPTGHGNGGEEGPYFEYYKNKIGTEQPADGSSTYRSAGLLNDPSQLADYYVRTMVLAMASGVRMIVRGGSLAFSDKAIYKLHILPCCVIS